MRAVRVQCKEEIYILSTHCRSKKNSKEQV